MIDNYIKAPEYIIDMLKKDYTLENGDIDLKKLNPETNITACETEWSSDRVDFETYGGAPASVFAILCETFPKEPMTYFFYSHDSMGNSMKILNLDGDAVLDPEYEVALEMEEKAMRADDEDHELEEDFDSENDSDALDYLSALAQAEAERYAAELKGEKSRIASEEDWDSPF